MSRPLSRSSRSMLAVALVGGLVASLGVAPAQAAPAAPTAPTPLVAAGPFSADADASLLRIDLPALSPPVLPQTNVDVGRSQASTDSDGDLDGGDAGAQRTA
ncbi:MAG: hypothetical protein H0W25_01950, partial [Acidimicrobiia bacterium]|nr:hypothetical protein [Acidimicrobiia bacterium]